MVRIEDTVSRPNQPFPWTEERRKGPVLFKHGARSDGYVWLLGIFEAVASGALPSPFPLSLPEIYFNEGYDVWISNARGSKYSRTHTQFDADSDDPNTGAVKYWDFNVE